MMIALKHKDTGVIKELKLGFSWTMFFFGIIVYMIRGNWSEVVKFFFLNSLTVGIYGLVQAFTANRKEIVRYMERGYITANEDSRKRLVEKGIL